MLNLRLIAQIFSASKFRVPTTFNADICSLVLVHYAANSHHLSKGPTFGKKNCLFGGYVGKNAKDILKWGLGKKS